MQWCNKEEETMDHLLSRCCGVRPYEWNEEIVVQQEMWNSKNSMGTFSQEEMEREWVEGDGEDQVW